MKLVFFSDTHVHPFKLYASVDSLGINSRLSDCIEAINLTHKVAVEEDADLVLFGGDLFHQRRHVNTIAFNKTYDSLNKFKDSNIPVFAIHGNHDQSDREGKQYSIYGLSSVLKIADACDWYCVKDKHGKSVNIFAVPYTEVYERFSKQLREKPKNNYPTIFLGHLGINGAKTGSDFVYYSAYDLDVKDLKPKEFDAGFLGHFHEYQELGNNFYYIGAPLGFNWGDINSSRGCLIYDTDTSKVTRKLFNLPMFMSVDFNFDSSTFKNNYVRILVDNEWSFVEEEELKKASGARYIKTIEKSKDEKVHKLRSSIQPNMAFSEMIERYVSLNPSEQVSSSELVKVGKLFLDGLE